MEFFGLFFFVFFLLAIAVSAIAKKPFLVCLGSLFMVGAVVLVVWSFIIDDGSRRGMEAFVLLLMWSFAAAGFLIGYILRRIGNAQARKSIEPIKNCSRNGEHSNTEEESNTNPE